MTTLYVQDGDGFREASAQDVISCAQGFIARRFRSGTPVMDAPCRTREFLTLRLASLDYEVFGCLFLDNRHRLIAGEDLFRGTIDGTSVHPREVVKAALQHGAAACIFYHNHPSSLAEPSQADQRITGRLKEALALIDVRVIDHLIVGERIFSFAESGLL